ncbi:MAG: ABC transporter ATP-binding protein [Actinobacteria bacterium]|nr:ABC transporter ATP-binding protein [Actinomycetota bacterium]MCL6095736.1 ABC transporter ATP-binding protein [Actinomycetota bacterium]
MYAVELADLHITYGKKIAVSGVSFNADFGTTVAILGPNGAGKTSTIETLEGYRKPSKGRVRVLGLDPIKDHSSLVKYIGVMLQSGGIYTSMTPREAVHLFASYYDDHLDPVTLLETVALERVASTPWRKLSGGERQRLSLALALVGKPRVVFLDEPTAGVDPEGRIAIRQVISTLVNEGACVILTTHELEEAEKLAHKVIIINEGRKVAEGSPWELRERTTLRDKGIRIQVKGNLDAEIASAQLEVQVEKIGDDSYFIYTESSPDFILSLARWLAQHNITLYSLGSGPASLEEVYINLTESAPQTPNLGHREDITGVSDERTL